MKRIDALKEAEIVFGYAVEKLGRVKLARLHGVSESTVGNVLERNRVDRRSGNHPVYNTHFVDEDFFETIDTEAKAYWLGFVAADGCVTRNEQVFNMRLADRDAAHLEAFRLAVGYTGPVSRRMQPGGPGSRGKRAPCVFLAITRQRFCRHLVNQGIHPRKTWSLAPPAGNVPDSLLRHYYRGLVDGDGWVTSGPGGRNGRTTWTVGLCGTRAICDGFAEFVADRTGVSLHTRNKQTIYRVAVSGVEYPRAVAKLLYDGAAVYLPRKRERADRLMAVESERSRLITHNGVTRTAQDWCADVGISSTVLRTRLARGMPLGRALTMPPKWKRITWRGETHLVSEWAAILGVDRRTIEARLKKGEPLERVLRPLRGGPAYSQ